MVRCKRLVGLRYTSSFCWITKVPYPRGYVGYWIPALELNENLCPFIQAQPFCPRTVDGYSDEKARWYRLRFRKRIFFLLNQKPPSLFLAYTNLLYEEIQCLLACMFKIVVSILLLKTRVEKKHLKYWKENSEGKGDGYNITYNHSQYQSTGDTEDNAKEKEEQHKTNISEEKDPNWSYLVLQNNQVFWGRGYVSGMPS